MRCWRRSLSIAMRFDTDERGLPNGVRTMRGFGVTVVARDLLGVDIPVESVMLGARVSARKIRRGKRALRKDTRVQTPRKESLRLSYALKLVRLCSSSQVARLRPRSRHCPRRRSALATRQKCPLKPLTRRVRSAALASESLASAARGRAPGRRSGVVTDG
eukprot:scaffold301_cov243-Pinguiococcus_pyrenoidosus.AAC.110